VVLGQTLAFLAAQNPAEWPEGLQADCLRALAVATSRQTALNARVLSVFSRAGGGLEGDGHGSPKMWLTWQTKAARRDAGVQVGWMRRLAAHPAAAAALAAGQLSVSWARQICDWSDKLPEPARPDADQRLLAAAAAGAALGELAGLAGDLAASHAQPDGDDPDDPGLPDADGFADRCLFLATTLDGVGRIEGNLTGECAAALAAVLDVLGRRTGPEDKRTAAQRRHDGLHDGALRLIGAGPGMLPSRGGQPVHLNLDIPLSDLVRGDAAGNTCDAVIQPVITGTADHGLLAKLADPATPDGRKLQAALAAAAAGDAAAILDIAVRLLSGPGGYAAMLRRGLTGVPAVAGAVSLPLDVGAPSDTIPVHLRRAVRRRDKHCRFPGCDQEPDACEVHHLIPRAQGGPHALTNMILLCWQHHHVFIHRHGWKLTLHGDGTTSAVSPDRSKALHSHAPPPGAA